MARASVGCAWASTMWPVVCVGDGEWWWPLRHKRRTVAGLWPLLSYVCTNTSEIELKRRWQGTWGVHILEVAAVCFAPFLHSPPLFKGACKSGLSFYHTLWAAPVDALLFTQAHVCVQAGHANLGSLALTRRSCIPRFSALTRIMHHRSREQYEPVPCTSLSTKEVCKTHLSTLPPHPMPKVNLITEILVPCYNTNEVMVNKGLSRTMRFGTSLTFFVKYHHDREVIAGLPYHKHIACNAQLHTPHQIEFSDPLSPQMYTHVVLVSELP
ncbi:hypothetical protein EI94DRAFT_1707270 [Lactarius quietus]|nr:hypothetical protein EI94DRAFT_1707270 [Lactarius quietus]